MKTRFETVVKENWKMAYGGFLYRLRFLEQKANHLISIKASFIVAFEEIKKYRPTLLNEIIKNILRILPAPPLPQYRACISYSFGNAYTKYAPQFFTLILLYQEQHS